MQPPTPPSAMAPAASVQQQQAAAAAAAAAGSPRAEAGLMYAGRVPWGVFVTEGWGFGGNTTLAGAMRRW